MHGMLAAIGYFKATETGSSDRFGNVVALTLDGNTPAVGADLEDSNATRVGGDQDDISVDSTGAV